MNYPTDPKYSKEEWDKLPKAFIDGKPFVMEKGETILNFVRRYKEKGLVPTLCDAPNLDPFGSCRVCSVEVANYENGPLKTMASCHTLVAEGQYIFTSSQAIKELRKNICKSIKRKRVF